MDILVGKLRGLKGHICADNQDILAIFLLYGYQDI